MTYYNKSWHLQAVSLALATSLTQCQINSSQEQQTLVNSTADTTEVTSFNIEREENSPALANWAVFEVGREIICAPPNWQARTKDTKLIISPPNSTDSIERITFNRLAKDSQKLDYVSLVQTLANKAFSSFITPKGDTLKYLVFERGFGYERDTKLLAHGVAYQGRYLVYTDDRFIYEYCISLSEKRVQAYEGNLFSDIIGNLQVDKQYLISNDNPLKKVTFIRKQ